MAKRTNAAYFISNISVVYGMCYLKACFILTIKNMRKYLIVCTIGVGMLAFFNSCDDPMDSIEPVKEVPNVTTDGTGDGSGPEKDKPGTGD